MPGEDQPEHDPDERPDERGDDALVPDHPPRLTARQADRAQHPDLPRALEHRQHERVDDPEQAHDHREREQHVEDVQDRVEPRDLVVDELLAGLHLRVRVARRAPSRSRPGSRPTRPPAILRNVNRSFGCGFSASHVAAEIVTEPNGEPPVGGSKIPFTRERPRLAGDERDRDRRPDREVVVVGVPVVDERPVVAERREDVLGAVLPHERHDVLRLRRDGRGVGGLAEHLRLARADAADGRDTRAPAPRSLRSRPGSASSCSAP